MCAMIEKLRMKLRSMLCGESLESNYPTGRGSAYPAFAGSLCREICKHGLFHLARRRHQPPVAPLFEIRAQYLSARCAQMDVGRLPAHGVQQMSLVVLFWERREFDA